MLSVDFKGPDKVRLLPFSLNFSLYQISVSSCLLIIQETGL